MDDLISLDPCTGEEVWRGRADDPAAVVERARFKSVIWAAIPLDGRIAVRRAFQAVPRGRSGPASG